MAKRRFLKSIAIVVVVVVGVAIGLNILLAPKPDAVVDEAMEAGLTAKDMPGSTDDYLKDMDRGWDKKRVFEELANALQTSPETLTEVWKLSEDAVWDAYNKGRNNWVVWTGGNDRFWDFMANNTFGALDLLKVLSSHPSIQYCANKSSVKYGDGYGAKPASGGTAAAGDAYAADRYPAGYWLREDDVCEQDDRMFYPASRANRWKYYGLVNEPGYEVWDSKGCDWKNDKKTGAAPYGKCGNPDRKGLWLDKRVGDPDPFENDEKYPGVKIGARGKNIEVGSYYGYGTGIVGLRLFPNPDFDTKAEKAWDPVKYYNDADYYRNKDLVRPYRVGMACGFCHVGPSPIHPPKDPENPEWANLTSNPGAQYFWIDRIFVWNPKKRHENFVYQLFHTSLPGTLDTSFISSDNINNPRTMNAVYSIAARLGMAKHAREKLTGGELNNKQFNDYDLTKILSPFFDPPDTVLAPHVLKDGADSVGVLGALNRVYLNIGLASKEWLLHFRPLIGSLPFKRITPIEISVLEKNSTYWNANLTQTPSLAAFFTASAQPDLLKDAPGGASYLTDDEAKLTQGKKVFAENCGRCHSGKQPPLLAPGGDPNGTFCPLGSECQPGQIVENSGEYFDWLRREVQKPDFLEHNFLSTERRIKVTELGTNACSPLATNGLRGDIWDNFTSTTYKELPAVGKVTVHHPKTGEPWEYEMPAGGRGYTRPASLISIWSTPPFLLNNSVGNFYGEASVAARMASFDDSIQKMLWPEKRRKDSVLPDKLPGYIQRTTSPSYLRVPAGYLPDALRTLLDWKNSWFSWFYGDGEVCIGPIPKDTPVSLLANIPLVSESEDFGDRKAHVTKLVQLLLKVKKDLKKIDREREALGGKICEDIEYIDEAMNNKLKAAFADVVPLMIELSKCPDYVINRGHYFGSNLGDDDKWALIEFLKTF